MNLVLKTSVKADQLCVSVLVSRLDAAIARDFKSGIEEAWSKELSRVEIDLSTVEFIDSSGVGALLSVFRQLPVSVGAARLIHVRPSVQSVLELLRLHRVFELVP